MMISQAVSITASRRSTSTEELSLLTLNAQRSIPSSPTLLASSDAESKALNGSVVVDIFTASIFIRLIPSKFSS
ncbi:hypothetical protein F2Q69_00046019 [Brassica cretica]|uniref:Uncharacterized protein n=1 Tax=Brassica cretica TaxID=69181 RepID=A0A8S9PSF3_BRACR|nr:hypothetical protein F2Q69_00046019 [Brassica cretica]